MRAPAPGGPRACLAGGLAALALSGLSACTSLSGVSGLELDRPRRRYWFASIE
ncbi:hypothetical protein WME94_43685 [Sorangium sp. So ce429]